MRGRLTGGSGQTRPTWVATRRGQLSQTSSCGSGTTSPRREGEAAARASGIGGSRAALASEREQVIGAPRSGSATIDIESRLRRAELAVSGFEALEERADERRAGPRPSAVRDTERVRLA